MSTLSDFVEAADGMSERVTFIKTPATGDRYGEIVTRSGSFGMGSATLCLGCGAVIGSQVIHDRVCDREPTVVTMADSPEPTKGETARDTPP